MKTLQECKDEIAKRVWVSEEVARDEAAELYAQQFKDENSKIIDMLRQAVYFTNVGSTLRNNIEEFLTSKEE